MCTYQLDSVSFLSPFKLNRKRLLDETRQFLLLLPNRNRFRTILETDNDSLAVILPSFEIDLLIFFTAVRQSHATNSALGISHPASQTSPQKLW